MKNESSPNPWEISGIRLPQKPKLAPWAQVIDFEDNRLQIRGSELNLTLSHELFLEAFQAIRPLLDGSNELKSIESTGGETIKPTTIRYLLQMLYFHGVLKEGDESLKISLSEKEIADYQPQIDFWSHYFPDGRQPLSIISKSKVGLVGNGNLVKSIDQSLQSIGFRNIKTVDTSAVSIDADTFSEHFIGIDYLVACQASLNPGLFELVNELCLKNSNRWMHVTIEGTSAILGPSIIPFQTACYKCYERRIASNVQDLESHDAFQRKLIERNGSACEGFSPPLESILSSHVALEVARILTSFASPQTIGQFHEISGATLSIKSHPLLRVPRCPACRSASPEMDIWDTANSSIQLKP
jgi:bacteriocin biosynthesis cyclodehydratase domain-containing protein